MTKDRNLPSKKRGAMTFMGTQDGIGTRPQRETLGRAVGQGVELTVACLISYALITQILIRVYSVSREDDLLGGMWAVIATVFVYRESYQKSVSAAISRMSATVLSFALCLIYLLFLPFHALGMAALIGIGAVVLILADRHEDVITAAITTLGYARDWQPTLLEVVVAPGTWPAPKPSLSGFQCILPLARSSFVIRELLA